MPTLGDLMEKFGSAAAPADDNSVTDDSAVIDTNPAVEDGTMKTASGGVAMNSLQEIYLALESSDSSIEKEAAQAAFAPVDEEVEVDFAKMAAAIADVEADEVIAEDNMGGDEIVKIASEYDAAGRIMARGFYDEFSKLAGAMDTDVAPNTNAETPSQASTPALGDHGAVTVPTNYAGSPDHNQPIETAGPDPKKVYADSLKPKKTMSAGQGTEDDPEARAIAIGGGAPVGFTTMRELTNGKPA